MRKHLASLDGLRGVAALAVVGSHFENLSGFQLHLQGAGAAVDFFFVLSGFVIALAYEKRLEGGLSWVGYMRLRLERLYPAIFGALLLGLIVSIAAGDAPGPAVVAQFLFLPVLFGPVLHGGELFPLNGPQWSLFWELAINGVHAALLRWLTIPVLLGVMTLAAGALIYASVHFGSLDVGWNRQNWWGAAPRVIYSFGMGLLLFRLDARGFRAPGAPYLLIAAVLAACMVHWFPSLGLFWLRDLVIVLVILPALVAIAINSPVPARLTGAAAWLGALSYPLYAIHVPILRAFEIGLDELEGPIQTAGWWAALIATLILATLFERFYDAPIRRWLAARRGRVQAGVGERNLE